MTTPDLLMVIGAVTTAVVTVLGAVKSLRGKIEQVHNLVNSNFTAAKKSAEESNHRLILALEEVKRLSGLIADMTNKPSDADAARGATQDLAFEEGKVGAIIQDEKDF